MPNRYEREIEEILRNLEQAEPKTNQKANERHRPRTVPRPRPRSTVSPSLTAVEWLLITAVVLALVAGGYAYMVNANYVTGVMAIVSFLCVVLIACSQFLFRPRHRTTNSSYGNVTRIRRGPLSNVRARWQLMRLRMRYRKRDIRKP